MSAAEGVGIDAADGWQLFHSYNSMTASFGAVLAPLGSGTSLVDHHGALALAPQSSIKPLLITVV